MCGVRCSQIKASAIEKFAGGCKLSTPAQNILIAEDDVKLRLLLSAILAQAGYKVRTTEDGFSALAEIRTEAPDILLSDLYMSGMSGFELLSVVRRRFPAIQVIAMSSAFSGSDVPTGVAADAFYEKATTVATLLQIIEATILMGCTRFIAPTGRRRSG